MKFKKKYISFLVIVIILLLFIARTLFTNDKVDEIEVYDSFVKKDSLLEENYSAFLEENQNHITYGDSFYTVVPKDFIVEDYLRVNKANSNEYDTDVISVNSGDEIVINLDVEEKGMYYLNLDYYYLGNELFHPKLGVLINNQYPFYESRQVSLPVMWKPEISKVKESEYQFIHHYEIDRYQNEIQPKSSIVRKWNHSPLYDSSYINGDPLMFFLDEGENEIKLISRSDDLLIGRISLATPHQVPTYDDYFRSLGDIPKINDTIVIEAEYYLEKSDPSIKLYSDTNPSSTNYDSRLKKLNAIDAYTWDEAGRSVTWELNVPKNGLYKISFKYIQYRLIDVPAFRKIEIDGKIPFKELTNYPFQYTTSWKNETLHNDNTDFYFYLSNGKHEIKLTSVMEPYRPIIETIDTVMKEITDLTLEIKKLTGGKTDTYRDWYILEYIPDIAFRLNGWADELELAYRYGNSLNNTNKPAAELVNLKYAVEKLRKLADSPNEICNNLTSLSEGSTSASQFLGDLMLRLTKQSMGVEKFYLHDGQTLPSADANIFVKLFEGLKKFFLSFIPAHTTVNKKDENTIEVWVNRPRANIDLMQKMIDEEFTPATGIKVNLSLMPNANKLILANAAGIEPDVAMGVTNSTPYDFAIREAVTDFRQFEGYEEIVKNYSKGVMIPYVYDEGVYGLPETQDFYLTYYRTDLLGKLDVPIPDTWEEIVSILPELQRYGMNYYAPLGSSGSYKGFNLTLPYYYQNGANLYAQDGLSTTIDSEEAIEAMKLMTDLFATYDLPKQVSNFYNHFRYGSLPIGIGNSSTYLQLLIAAPEIKGNWGVGLYPGTKDETGNIKRYAPVSSSGIMIFNSSVKQQKAFEFIEWWLKTDTQIRFANDIQTMFGKEYMWISANINALKELAIDEEHKEIILEQLTWAVQAPSVPGGYYLEREISNAWSKIIFDDVNIRSAVDDAALNANREIRRKMIEFDYMDEQGKLKDYRIPTLENIDYWLKERR